VNYEALFAQRAGRRLRIGLAGAGEFGRSFLFRSGRALGIEVLAVADRDRGRALDAAHAAGIDPGTLALLEDGAGLAELPLDMIVEATGEPEAAARIAEAALSRGKHVAMVTKETDCVVGPILQAKAEAAGLVCTPVDGDQPSLLVALVSWARHLGLEVVCAGKAGEYDLVYDPREHGEAFWRDPAARPAKLGGRARATVPDYCELAVVANATGLAPDTPVLHAPVARPLELPNLFRPRADGGLLERPGVLDMFVCLRRADELSFAGGVFVVVRCDDRASWRVLGGKGIPVSDDGGYALLHNPVHLLGIEAPVSLLSAAQLGLPAARLRPRCDMLARATEPLAAGSVLAIGERHAVRGVEALLAEARRVGEAAPLPYYMAAGCRLRQDVAPGRFITRDLVEPPAGSALWRLRAEQDARFFGS
jgi:predicted homoserine dehydrogenase-like protein